MAKSIIDKTEQLHLSILAPSFKIPLADLQECLKSLDKIAKVNVKKPLFQDQGLCANTVESRAQDLKKYLNLKSDYIWCLRGGYGCLHLLPDLFKFKKPKQFKNLIGFSDITVLHYFLNQQWNWPTLHWKHINGFLEPKNLNDPEGDKTFNTQRFLKTIEIFKNQKNFVFEELRPVNALAQKTNYLKSKIVGGNLITLQSMVGTKIKLPKNKILFLEEVDEPVYKVDRALTQLLQTGWFDNVTAVCLGSFSNKNKSIEEETAKHLDQFFSKFKVPVFKDLVAGHRPDQKPLFLNTKTEIQKISKEKFSLTILNGFIEG